MFKIKSTKLNSKRGWFNKTRRAKLSSRGDNRFPSGYTLIEVLISLGVLAVVAGVGITILLFVTQLYAKAVISNNLRKEGSRIMEEVTRIVQGAGNLTGGGGSLTATLDLDSLEYKQNGRCETVILQLETPGPTDDFNGRLLKSLSDCEDSAVGAGVITSDDRVTGINIASLNFVVTDGGALRPDQVIIEITLEQGLDAPNRQEYKSSVSLRNVISTREY
ncbi:prepilin-type N-terminal cleavage/methylation domain-containing protein [Patescibacteria group bacterium]|nr:prepilin-type N-terminal cleavage/methylation domain-containing protein [Patescibacteria group bacterium]